MENMYMKQSEKEGINHLDNEALARDLPQVFMLRTNKSSGLKFGDIRPVPSVMVKPEDRTGGRRKKDSLQMMEKAMSLKVKHSDLTRDGQYPRVKIALPAGWLELSPDMSDVLFFGGILISLLFKGWIITVE